MGQMMRRKAGDIGKEQSRKTCALSQKDVSLCKSNKEALWEVKHRNDVIRCLFLKDSHLTAPGRTDCRNEDKKLGDPLEACGINPGKKSSESELRYW